MLLSELPLSIALDEGGIFVEALASGRDKTTNDSEGAGKSSILERVGDGIIAFCLTPINRVFTDCFFSVFRFKFFCASFKYSSSGVNGAVKRSF